MSLYVALQMDPIEHVSINGDSTFRLGLEAEARGYRLFQYTADKLSYVEGRVVARGRPVTLRREAGNHVTFGDWADVDLSEFDVVWLRQDPPFDMGYITNTHLLDRVHPGTFVVNDPFWVRNSPEKLLVLDFPELSAKECLKRSRRLMKGHKWQYFLLMVSFLPWLMGGFLTCGIGLLYVYPYQKQTYAYFYLELVSLKSAEAAGAKA